MHFSKIYLIMGSLQQQQTAYQPACQQTLGEVQLTNMAWVAGKGSCCSCSVHCWQQDWSGSSRGLESFALCHSSHTTPTLQI